MIAPVRRLSGGQRQAIAIARSTVNAHRLIQFDEPTAALGVRQTRATLDLIQRVAARGVAVIMISHNLDDVFAVAHRIVALRLGRISLNTLGRSDDARASCSVHDGSVVREGSLLSLPSVSTLSKWMPGGGRNVGLLVTLVLGLLLISLFSPQYLSLDNALVVALQISFVGIASLGTASLIIGGNVDCPSVRNMRCARCQRQCWPRSCPSRWRGLLEFCWARRWD